MKKQTRLIQERFMEWKRRLSVVPDLTTDRFGRFLHAGVDRQWAAYLECMSQHLPEQPPAHVIETMIAQGVRPYWAAQTYRDMRKSLIERKVIY